MLHNTRKTVLTFSVPKVNRKPINDNDRSNMTIITDTIKKFKETYPPRLNSPTTHEIANSFSIGVLEKLREMEWASALPNTFETDAIEHVLSWQENIGYDVNDIEGSIEKATRPFFERYNYLCFDAELGRRRDACNRGDNAYNFQSHPTYESYTLNKSKDNMPQRRDDIVDKLNDKLSHNVRNRRLSTVSTTIPSLTQQYLRDNPPPPPSTQPEEKWRHVSVHNRQYLPTATTRSSGTPSNFIMS